MSDDMQQDSSAGLASGLAGGNLGIPGEGANLDFLMDIPLEVTIELGRTKMLVKQLLGLKKNSVIELDREANEPVDILINNKRFARGEVVIEGDRIAIMITDIISPRERIQRLA